MNATTENNLEVANEIARQIGQRAFIMMGTTQKLGDEKSLAFDIKGSRAFTKCRITLEPSDTYTVEFFKFRKYAIVASKSFSDVYAENLIQVIESATGLFLSF